MKILTLILIALIALVQYPLWLGKGSWLKVWEIDQQVTRQHEINRKLQMRNAALDAHAQAQGESPLDEGKLMTPEECAQHILNAIRKRKRTLVLTFKGKQTVFLNKFFPKLADKFTRNYFYKNGKLVK